MAWISEVVAAALVLGMPVLARQGGDKQEAIDALVELAGSGSQDALTEELALLLADGTLLLTDLERPLFDAPAKKKVALARAARLNASEENIARVHARWHSRADDRTTKKDTSDFVHYRFLFFEGMGLFELGRAAEAAQRFEAIRPHAPKNALGLARYPYEGQLARAYNALGRHAEALELLGPVHAIAGTAWMRTALEEAYAGTGRDPATLDAYLGALRTRCAVEMRPFEATDYEGTTVHYDDIKGPLTLITTWFPGCYGCRLEMPFLQELLERYEERGLRIAAVETTRASAAARAYREEHYGFATFPFLENGPPEKEVVESYLGANGNATFLINRHNKVVLAWAGWGKHLEAELEKRVLEELELP